MKQIFLKSIMTMLALPFAFMMAFLPYYTLDYFWQDKSISPTETQHITAVMIPVMIGCLIAIWAKNANRRWLLMWLLTLPCIALYYVFMALHLLVASFLVGSDDQAMIVYLFTTGQTIAMVFKFFLIGIPFGLWRLFIGKFTKAEWE